MKLKVSPTWVSYVLFLIFALQLAIKAAGGEIPLSFENANQAEAIGLIIFLLVLAFFVISCGQMAWRG